MAETGQIHGVVLGERDRFIDVIRVAAILVVVFGHWLTTSVIWDGDVVVSANALSYIPATRAATWIVQVMPLVFFAGGFANARYLERAGGSSLAFLRGRIERLLAPALVFLGVWTVLGLLIEWFDPSSPGKIRAAESAALPVWFLGIYLIAVALTPSTMRLHHRFGIGVPIVLMVMAALVDLVSIGMGMKDLGGINYAVVWLLAHQIGYLYADGTLQGWGTRGAALLAGAGLSALVILTAWGGYPVSLVGVPGHPRSNAQPPSLAMVAGIVWLVGLALLLRPAAQRLVSGDAWWRRTDRLHGLLLTTFIWHVSAVSVGAWIWRAAGWPEPDIGSKAWWALRPAWVALLMPPLLLLLWLFGRFEIHRAPRPAPPITLARGVAAGLGVFSVAVGILGFGETGFIPFAPEVGEVILVFTFNPLQNIVHLAIGGLALWGAFLSTRPGLIGLLAAVGFGGMGVLELADAAFARPLGMDGLTGVTHVVVAGIALIGLTVGALLSLRRPVPR